MASIPSNLKLTYKAYNSVLFDGVPMWRAQAWALLDARLSGHKFTVNSAIRRESIVKKYRGHGLRPNYSSQEALYVGFRAGRPGFFPANPPNATSHAGYSDGNPHFHAAWGRPLPEKYMWGIDAVNYPGGDAASLVSWLNAHGYHAVRPYNTASERHHFMFTKSPAANARKRLAKHVVKKVVKRRKKKK